MVKRRREKGEVAKALGITICVDDAYECVHSMALACYPNWQLGILFGGRPSPQGSPHDDWVQKNTVVAKDCGDVAESLGDCYVEAMKIAMLKPWRRGFSSFWRQR